MLVSTLWLLQGNRTNHSVIFDGKIVDHVNYLLRGGKYGDSSEEKVTLSKYQ